MSTETFMVAFHNGYWRIGYEGRWYGTYPNRDSAEQVAIGIAMQTGELPTRVVVLEQDGSEEVVWQPSNQGHTNPPDNSGRESIPRGYLSLPAKTLAWRKVSPPLRTSKIHQVTRT